MDPTSLQGSAQRVAFTADFLRCSVTSGRYRNAQSRNVSWLREVLTGGLAWRRQSLELQTVFPAEGSRAAGADALGRGALAEYKADAEDAWARRYDVDQLKVFKPYLEALVGFDLVVGFELPPSVKRHLHCHGRRYVSFHIHALRMLRDLCLGATTNDPAIAKLLTDAAVPEHEISRQVHRFRALCSFHRVPELMLPEGLPVLIGQTARDSILISAGRFVDWPDCEDELALALRDHDACIFLEHPGRQDSRSVCEYLRCRLGKAVIATSTNGYGALLSTARIPEVLTLSSSLGVEAQAFGLPTRFLLGDPRQRMRVDGVDLGVDRPLTHHVLGDDFWNAIWGDGPPSQVPNDGFYLGEHYLRDSLVSWSYQLLRDRLQGARSRRTWMPAAGMDSPRRTSLLTALRDGPDGMGAGESTTVLALDAPLALGQHRKLHGGDPDFGALLYSGFYAPDPWGVWSRPGRSEIMLPIQPSAGATLTLTLEVRCFDGLLERCPVLQIMCGDQLCGLVMFRAAGATSARVRVRLDASCGPVRVTLVMSESISPLQAGLSPDPREFGFGLTEIELEMVATRAGDAPDTIPVWGVTSATAEPVAVSAPPRWNT